MRMTATSFPALLQRFFTDRLCTQMEASRHTVAGYRDTFLLLILFASAQCGKLPTKLEIEDLNADEITALLSAPDRTTWAGRRDHALLLVALQTGLRASELVGLRCGDVVL